MAGHYEQKPIGVDKILHTTAGASMAMLGGWVLQNFFAPAQDGNSRFENLAIMIGGGLSVAVAFRQRTLRQRHPILGLHRP